MWGRAQLQCHPLYELGVVIVVGCCTFHGGVTDREQGNPCLFVMTNTMNKEKEQHEVTEDCTWYSVHHQS
jgi:hypothetical protein